MPKFKPSDDGKVIDGKVVVFLEGAAAAREDDSKGASGPAADAGLSKRNQKRNGRGATAAAQAATLSKAAKAAVPFCEQCEKKKKEHAAQAG